MAKQDCGPEIMELQKQMEELKSQQAAREERVDSAPELKASTTADKGASGELAQVREKLEEFAELLQQDLKQIQASTAIGIFALGVLMGRLMSK
jgi:hypothetical protein